MDTTSQKNFKGFYRSLKPDDRERLAAMAQTTTTYIEIHLINVTRIPRPKLMASLYDACRQLGATFSKSELMDFFYGQEQSRITEQVSA